MWLGLMVSESICSSKVTTIFWFCGTQVAPATRLTAITYGAEVSLVARVVKEKSKGAASGVPLMSLAPTVMLALYLVLGAKSGEGLKLANHVGGIVSDCTSSRLQPEKVLELMLAGSMGWLNTTAISRLVPTPLLCGTTIDTAGPLRGSRWLGNATTANEKSRYQKGRREPWRSVRLTYELLSQYLLESETRQVGGATLGRAAKLAWEQNLGAHRRHEPSVDSFRIMSREAEAVCSESLTSSLCIVGCGFNCDQVR